MPSLEFSSVILPFLLLDEGGDVPEILAHYLFHPRLLLVGKPVLEVCPLREYQPGLLCLVALLVQHFNGVGKDPIA